MQNIVGSNTKQGMKSSALIAVYIFYYKDQPVKIIIFLVWQSRQESTPIWVKSHLMINCSEFSLFMF